MYDSIGYKNGVFFVSDKTSSKFHLLCKSNSKPDKMGLVISKLDLIDFGSALTMLTIPFTDLIQFRYTNALAHEWVLKLTQEFQIKENELQAELDLVEKLEEQLKVEIEKNEVKAEEIVKEATKCQNLQVKMEEEEKKYKSLLVKFEEMSHKVDVLEQRLKVEIELSKAKDIKIQEEMDKNKAKDAKLKEELEKSKSLEAKFKSQKSMSFRKI